MNLTLRSEINHRGFTLIEALLTASLVAVIGLAIFNIFSQALKLWDRAQKINVREEVAMCMSRMGDDVRSTVRYAAIKPSGTGTKFSIPAHILTKADERGERAEEGLINQIGSVEYLFSPAEGIIYRRQANYSQALKKVWSNPVPMAHGIDDVEFKYYMKNGLDVQVKSILDGAIPHMICVKIHVKGDDLGRWYKRYMYVPVGG